MKKRIHIYVERTHPAVWGMVVCMLASAVSRVILLSGAEGIRPWTGIVLSVMAAVLYALTTILSGREMFYKTSISVWLMGLSHGVYAISRSDGMPVLFLLGVLLFCGAYWVIVSGCRYWRWLLMVLYAAALGIIGYVFRMDGPACVLPELLVVLGMLVLLFGMRADTDDRYHPTWGDRIDGRRIRTAPAMEQITAYFMPNRTGANNLFATSVEITELERYVRRKRREGLKGFGLSHVIMAAYVRTVAKYPALNRFIAGQRMYSRGENIALCMTVKKEMSAEAPDSLIKVHLNPADTADDVYRKFNAKVAEAKDEMQNTTADNTADGFMMIPGLVLKFVVWLLKTMDYFGMVPLFLLEVSPFHGSVYFTSMGSLGIQPVYHHLYDFGTVPVFCSFGSKRRAEEMVNGEIVERKYVDLKFNLDERICDGFYYANVIKYFQRLLRHPDMLDVPPESVEKDIP